METILIVEDDSSIAAGLQQNLRFEGYQVLAASDGQRGLELVRKKRPDLVLLDVMLPKMNGYELCKTARKEYPDLIILMLTAKGEVMDRVMGLELGADDYMAKPFSIQELLARVKALLRRRQTERKAQGKMRIGEAVVDFEAHTIARGGKELESTAKEFDLLAHLIDHPHRALRRDEILNRVWGADYFGTPRTVDNFIAKLRQKIEKNPEAPKHLHTIRGFGYKFTP
jgi:DNA-binding response OmpR family regulator